MSKFEPRMFIPGPTEVFPEILETLSRPVISHRGPEIQAITEEIFGGLKYLFQTQNECWFALSAATGLMEGSIRNLVRKKVLCTVCGAFSDRQAKVAEKCGKAVDTLEVEFGQHVTPDAVHRALEEGDYDVVTVVHSETSTGILNPIAEIAEIVRAQDDVLLVVDCVSSLAGAPVLVDEWGADVVFAGTQKCMALPPGLCLFTVSPRAMERAESIPNRGHYFDFLNYRKMAERNQSPATTSIPLVYALQAQLRRIREETLEQRWQRHETMATLARERLSPHFPLFPDPEHMTPTETVFLNSKGLDVEELLDRVRARGRIFGNGYGPLKGKTFRIGHMGDIQPHHLDEFLKIFEEELASLG